MFATPTKAALSGEMCVAEAFSAIATACLAHYRSSEAFFIAAHDPEALHQMRVGLSQLRSAFWFFKPLLTDASSKALRHDLRDFAKILGAARNVDVCITHTSKGSTERKWLKRQRMRLYDRALEELSHPSSRQFLFEIAAWSDSGDWRNSQIATLPLLPLATERLDRLWRRIRKFGPDPAKLRRREQHQLRIQIKMVHYSLDFLEAPLRPVDRERKEFVSVSGTLQNALGGLNDLMVCGDLRASAGLRPKRQREKRKAQFRDAKRSLRALRRIGPFWNVVRAK